MATLPAVPWGDFLALPENRSALRAARSVARTLVAGKRSRITPLVLHGPPGVGKSHLTTALLRATGDGPAVVTAQSVSVGDLARTSALRWVWTWFDAGYRIGPDREPQRSC